MSEALSRIFDVFYIVLCLKLNECVYMKERKNYTLQKKKKKKKRGSHPDVGDEEYISVMFKRIITNSLCMPIEYTN